MQIAVETFEIGMNKGKIKTVREKKKKQRNQTIINAQKGTQGRKEVREKLKISEQQLKASKAHHGIG